MTCFKCDGTVCQDKMYDLPKTYREYYCVNCGERFWVDMRTRTLDIRSAAAPRLQTPNWN